MKKSLARRALLIGVTLLGSALVMSFSLATAIARERPTIATIMAPYLSAPKAELAEAMLPIAMQAEQQNLPPAPIRQAKLRGASLARAAALLDPLNPAPIRTLAYLDRAEKRNASASQLIAYADKLSRRDLAVNLDFVMEAAKRGDLDQMLRYFDIALRTSRGSWDRLFPIIYQASVSPDIAAPLAKVLAKDPQWAWPFLDGLVRQGPDPLVTARLFDELETIRPIENDNLNRALIARLFETGNYAEAFARHRALVKSKGFTSVTNGDFEREPLGTAFEWSSIGETGLEVAIAQNSSSKALGKSLYFRVPEGSGGEIIRATMAIPPGQHLLSAELGEALQGVPGELTFEAECLGTGASIARRILTRPSAGRIKFDFVTPRNCPGVRAYIRANSIGTTDTWASWIDRIQLDQGAF